MGDGVKNRQWVENAGGGGGAKTSGGGGKTGKGVTVVEE